MLHGILFEFTTSTMITAEVCIQNIRRRKLPLSINVLGMNSSPQIRIQVLFSKRVKRCGPIPKISIWSSRDPFFVPSGNSPPLHLPPIWPTSLVLAHKTQRNELAMCLSGRGTPEGEQLLESVPLFDVSPRPISSQPNKYLCKVN